MLIAAVYLRNVGNPACALSTEGCQEQRDTCADVGTCHAAGTQTDFPVVTNHNGAVRVAENDLCPHVDKFINEEETALKHFLMEQHTATGLRSHNEQNGDKVGGESARERRPAS